MKVTNIGSKTLSFNLNGTRYQLGPSDTELLSDIYVSEMEKICETMEDLILDLGTPTEGDPITAHEAAANPHNQYALAEDLETLEQAENPFPQYLQDLPQVWSGGIWIARPSSGGNDTTGTGSFNKPFATLQKAIDWINNTVHDNTPVNNPTIFVKPGEYNLVGALTIDGTANPNLANGLTIIGVGNSDSQPVKFLGGFVLQGNITRFRLKDLSIAPTGIHSLDVNGTQGRHYFDNVTFSGGLGIRYRGSYQRWSEFMNCTCSTAISLGDGSCLANSSVRFRGFSDWGGAFTVADANMRLELLDTYRAGRITHSAGKVFISRLDEIRSSNANAIESTASGANDKLVIVNTNLRRWDTLVFGLINKTGTCDYDLFNVNRNSGLDILTGSQM